MTKHSYGGIWTREKLRILDEYAGIYANALKEQKFTLHYADVFAGTGKQDVKEDERQVSALEIEALDGSVSKMVEKKLFHQFHFNDNNPAHCEDLHRLVEDKGLLNRARVTCMDANDFVLSFTRNLKRRDRVLMFVDPYSTQLNWDSLVAIAKTQKIDAWFLFPIGPVSRLLPNDKNKLIDAYRKPLNRLFGSNEWEEVLYRQKEPPLIDDMFAQVEPKELGHERVTQESVEIYTKERLQTLFPLVEGPHALYSSKSKLFNLYFCCANPNPKAWGLAKRLSANVFKRAKLKEL